MVPAHGSILSYGYQMMTKNGIYYSLLLISTLSYSFLRPYFMQMEKDMMMMMILMTTLYYSFLHFSTLYYTPMPPLAR